VASTVVDPREHAGRLPRKLRKAWRRSGSARGAEGAAPEDKDDLPSARPVPFQSLRAWFGTPPAGVDARYRHPDLVRDDGSACSRAGSEQGPQPLLLPVCDERHGLVRGCSALAALHPDEATDAAVDAAVRMRRPFCVVPCCVFSRLFPHRRVYGTENSGDPGAGRPVHTRQDLVDYLCEKHPSIRRTTLPFVGANVVVWSTF
jgi:hypothetical protein